MEAPTVQQLLGLAVVREALEAAWDDSLADDWLLRHEEGGWIYLNITTAAISIRRAPPGGRASVNLSSPPVVAGAVVVATFHTHPNPAAEGWNTGPGNDDSASAWFLGVPCIIRAEDGVHSTGPDARRGGLSGGHGFPPLLWLPNGADR